MQFLHAYWRMPYIEAPKPQQGGENPFPSLLEADDERAALVLFRSPLSAIILNKFPYNAGHLLVLPRREVPQLADLTAEERADLMENIIRAQNILTRALQPHGFNIGFNIGEAAGAGIPTHLHAHVVPRWNGDHNFMPVVGNTRVLPQSLEAMWERLRPFAN